MKYTGGKVELEFITECEQINIKDIQQFNKIMWKHGSTRMRTWYELLEFKSLCRSEIVLNKF
jgi:hypothetical protein